MNLKSTLLNLIIKLLPDSSALKVASLTKKYARVIRFMGKGTAFHSSLNVIRNNGLMLGKEVKIEGGGLLDATAGIMIGDKTTVQKGVEITTVENDGSYNPVIIGAGNSVEKNISPGTILPNKIEVNGLSSYKGQIVFIVSTGRSGSNAIAKLIDQHSDADCYHDSFPPIYSYANDKLYNRTSDQSIKERIISLYNACDMSKGIVHGQSDQKLSALIPILAELFPQAKFLWLIRSADSFVNSSYPRGWFRNSEFGYGENKEEFFPQLARPSDFDAAHRTNGYLLEIFTEEEWKSMTAFERNCWYWTYWNTMIENELSKIDASRSKMIRLNQLNEKTPEILNFLNLSSVELETKKTNKAKYKKIGRQDWNEKMETIYEKWCTEKMNQWFN